MHGARGGAPEGKRNGNYRHGARTKETIRATRFDTARTETLGPRLDHALDRHGGPSAD